MLNNKTTPRGFKDAVYGAFATVSKALGSPRRLELLDILVQGPRSVEALARAVAQPVPNTSQHLQVLKRAWLVETTRHGTTVEYRLAPGVAEAFATLRQLAEARSPELSAEKSTFFMNAGAESVIDAETLRRRLDEGSALLLDVRPADEFAAGHIEGARSIPLGELEARIDELPVDRLLVATCRGPYCVFAADAVRLLRERGREAVRFEDGVAEWRLRGGAVREGAAA